MAWVGGSVAIGDKSASDTAAMLQEWTAKWAPRATGRACALGSDDAVLGQNLAGRDCVGIEPHVTLLYHGHATSDALRGVCDKWKLDELQYAGTVKGFHEVVQRFPDGGGFFGLVLDVACEPLQDGFAAFKAEVAAATGEVPMQSPHTVPPGETPNKHDYRPHVTLARWASPEDLAADMADIRTKCAAFWPGLTVAIGPFVLYEK